MDQNPSTLKWVPFCSNFNRWNPWMFIPKKTWSSVLNPIPNVILDLMFFYMSKFSQKLQYGGYEVNYYELPKRRQDQRSWNIVAGCIHASISIDKRIQSVCKPGTTHQFTKNAIDLSFFFLMLCRSVRTLNSCHMWVRHGVRTPVGGPLTSVRQLLGGLRKAIYPIHTWRFYIMGKSAINGGFTGNIIYTWKL